MQPVSEQISPEALMHEAHTATLESDLLSNATIAVDIECLIDYGITSLLIMTDAEGYPALYKQLHTYSESCHPDRLDTLAAAIGLTGDMCRKHAPSHQEFDHFVQTKDTLRRIVDETMELAIRAPTPPIITIYTGGRYVPQSLQHICADMFSGILHAKVVFSKEDICALSCLTYAKMGTLFSYDFEKLLHSPNFGVSFGKMELVGLRVFAHRIISSHTHTEPDTVLLQRSAGVLGTLFEDFEFLTMRLTNL